MVAAALHDMVPADDAEALGVLLALLADEVPDVRQRAATTVSDHDADTPAVREALARLLADADPAVALEAARGLGLRDDPRADVPLVRAHLDRPAGEIPEISRTYDVIRRWPLGRFLAVREALADPDPAAG